jgi:hypothetical protein
MTRLSNATVHLEPLLVALHVLLRYTGVDLVDGLQAATKTPTDKVVETDKDKVHKGSKLCHIAQLISNMHRGLTQGWQLQPGLALL